ncbi:MAG: helicase-related protein, partial [Vulcanococcus sp.]
LRGPIQAILLALMLHRRKEDCLDLPPKQRQLRPVTLSDAEGQGFQHRLQLKVEDYRRRAAAGLVRRDAEALAVLTALRQIGAEYKLPSAQALLEPLLEQGESVVVFTAFVAAAELLQQRLGGALLTGRLPASERQGVVDRFQSGCESLLISTYGVGGLGFTMHRARHVLLLERPWTPGDAEQAEDRCHRIGMQSALQCYWLQLGVADQLVDGLIADKAERIALLLNRGTQQLRRQALPKMVQELLDRW